MLCICLHILDGNLFILIGSHIGISNTGKLGQFSRLGQDRDGTACGAAVGALNYCCSCENAQMPTFESLGENPHDYQMQYLISKVNEKKSIINDQKDENARQAELAKQCYYIAQVSLLLQ